MSRSLRHGVLGLHVFRFVGHQMAERLQICENHLRLVGMDVDLQNLIRADDDKGIPLLPETVLDR